MIRLIKVPVRWDVAVLGLLSALLAIDVAHAHTYSSRSKLPSASQEADVPNLSLAAGATGQDGSPRSEMPANAWVKMTSGSKAIHPGQGGDVRWVYDRANDVFVMFAGDGLKNCDGVNTTDCSANDGYDGGYKRTTWIYSLTKNEWRNAIVDNAPKGYPRGRCQPALAYDTKRGVVWMTGGASSRNNDEAIGYPWGGLWKWDTKQNTWTQVSAAPPANRAGLGMPVRTISYDTVNDKLILITRDNAFIYDPVTNAWVGKRGANKPDFYTLHLNPDSYQGVQAFDENVGLLIVILRGQTWRYSVSQNAWTKSASAIHPAVHPYNGFVYDVANKISILYGAGNKHDETWAYDATKDTWTRLNPTVSAPGRWSDYNRDYVDQFAAGFSTKANAVVIWGNEPPGGGAPYPVWAFRYASTNATVPSSNPATKPITPPKPSSASGQINLPPRTWIARPLPLVGKGPCPPPFGCKHMRLAHNTLDGRIYFLGGDYEGPGSQAQSGRNEIYSYSIKDGDWRLESPYCRNDVSLPNPDEVGWAFDTKRKIFWMLPGFAFDNPPRCANGASGIFTFDPTTKKLTLLSPQPQRPVGKKPQFAVYDPVTDTILMFQGVGGNTVHVYDIQNNKWNVHDLAVDTNGKYVNDPPGYTFEYAAIDVEGRAIYLVNPRQEHPRAGTAAYLLRYNIDKKSITYLGDLPVPSGLDFNNFVWDSINRVLLWLQLPNLEGYTTLWIYDPRTKTWEKDPMVQPEGLTVRANHIVFDPFQNAIMAIGGLEEKPIPLQTKSFFLYRYKPGSTPPS